MGHCNNKGEFTKTFCNTSCFKMFDVGTSLSIFKMELCQ